jgi:hypothetical protein|tara:strand:- start:433 stop:714 length:282 start_codon:yes stop_codon:yes gene_type:complete
MLSTAIRRMGMLHNQLTTAPALVLDERILFPNLDERSTTNSNYKIHVDVRHDEKIIDFVTEALSFDDKMEVYLRQKKMMRDLYPMYIITERHT